MRDCAPVAATPPPVQTVRPDAAALRLPSSSLAPATHSLSGIRTEIHAAPACSRKTRSAPRSPYVHDLPPVSRSPPPPAPTTDPTASTTPPAASYTKSSRAAGLALSVPVSTSRPAPTPPFRH